MCLRVVWLLNSQTKEPLCEAESSDPSGPSGTGLLAREYFRGRAAVYFMTVLTSMALFKYLQSAGFQLSQPALPPRVGRGAAKTRHGIGEKQM